MKRNFPDWLKAYETYANDDFTPKQFNHWSGLSALAGALERKVWLPWNDTFSYYPNIYVLLVSLPGAGKSTALNKAVGMLQELNLRTGTLNILPSQNTEAKFIELMGQSSSFEHGNKIIYQSAGYFFASEASNSLKNLYGDFIACLTDFYDCPPFWEKATMKDARTTIQNLCLNVLAGSTYDYLGKLVTDDNIMGGFASRMIYVVHRDKLVRKQKFQLGGAQADPIRTAYRKALIEDLEQIHRLVGPFAGNAEFSAAWEKWYPVYEERRQSNPSEKLQSLLVRTNTNVLKLSMLYAVARGNDMMLTGEDWENALNSILPIEQEIPNIFREAKSNDVKTQDGINQAMFKFFLLNKTSPVNEFRQHLLLKGFAVNMVEGTVKSYMTSGVLRTLGIGKDGPVVELAANANSYI